MVLKIYNDSFEEFIAGILITNITQSVVICVHLIVLIALCLFAVSDCCIIGEEKLMKKKIQV